jgi:hypothetical protein
MRLLERLASLRLTLAGLVALIATVLAVYRQGDSALYWIAAPLTFMALNLLAAILTNRSFRLQPALLVFHVALLAVLLLAALGMLTRYEGRIELAEGSRFDPDRVETVNRGWLHRSRLREFDVVQGDIEVDYANGLRRAATRSELVFGGTSRRIGDRVVAEVAGYRLQSTFNKGYALVLVWDDGVSPPVAGTVHFPSYPEFEWKQRNEWLTPAGETLELQLVLDRRVPESGPWTLRSRGTGYGVMVHRAGHPPRRLAPGDTVLLRGGRATVADLRLWMGYRVDANPLLPWTLAAAFLALMALGGHFHRKFRPARIAAKGTIGALEQAA